MNVIGLGPFIGDFKTELTYFRPFVNWVQTAFPESNIYVHSHRNRSFLYDACTFVPVYESFSRDELNQKQILHKDISAKDYQLLVKDFRTSLNTEHPNDKETTTIYNLGYSNTSTKSTSIYQRIFKPIKFSPLASVPADTIVYIPEKVENIRRLENVYEFLKSKYPNVVVVGDLKTHLIEHNIPLNQLDYLSNGYKYILSYIAKAKHVICPASHWTMLCNLQKIPVFSWGKAPGQYKAGGEYHFGNQKSMAVYADKELSDLKLFKMIDHYFNQSERGKL